MIRTTIFARPLQIRLLRLSRWFPLRSVITSQLSRILTPLIQAGLPDPPDFPEEMLKRRESERQFLTQLLDGSKVEQYRIPVNIKAELRKYQQDGVNWLAFLAKFQLHGILCDGDKEILAYTSIS